MNTHKSRYCSGKTNPRRVIMLGAVALALGLSGCTAVPVYQQELVSSYGMVFSDSPVLTVEPALLTQMEPGVASTGGGQAAGCSSCR